MQSQSTSHFEGAQVSSESGASSVDPADRGGTPLARERTRRKFAWLRENKKKLSSEAGRHTCKTLKVSHRLVADLAEEIVNRFPSFMDQGEVYVGQAALAKLLAVHERQVRRAVAALIKLKSLQVARGGGRDRDTNTMAPLLGGKPIFAAGDNRATTSSQQKARMPSDKRASSPPNLKEGQENDSSPIGSLKSAERLAATPMEEERKADGRRPTSAQDTSRDARARSAPAGAQPQGTDEAEIAERTPASILSLGFAHLMRKYPHPPGSPGIEHPGYRAHARVAWKKLSTQQQQDALGAAPKAPRNEWVGHWLDNGRETGNFEIVEQPTEVRRVWVSKGTPQWFAWVDFLCAEGRRLLTTQHRVDGEMQTGWMFETVWPPRLENAERVGGCNE